MRGVADAVGAPRNPRRPSKGCNNPIGGDFTNRVIISIADVNCSAAYRHAIWIIKTSYSPGTVATANTSAVRSGGPCERGYSLGGSDLSDLVITRVRDVDYASSSGCDTVGTIESGGAAGAIDVPKSSSRPGKGCDYPG